MSRVKQKRCVRMVKKYLQCFPEDRSVALIDIPLWMLNLFLQGLRLFRRPRLAGMIGETFICYPFNIPRFYPVKQIRLRYELFGK